MSDAIKYIDDNRDRFVADLEELIRIPSVSAVSEHKQDVLRAADWLADHLKELGLAAEVIPTAGHPVVYASWLKAGDAPTLLMYGHYDVQPVDPLDLWRNPPFEPTREGPNLVARGATDDKGQMFAHVKAVESYLRTAGSLPINLKMVIEGEEEVGSTNLYPWVDANRERLACDAVVISDTAQFGDGIPAITYSLRGMRYFEVFVDGPDKDLHSGIFGGAVENPANVLCRLMAGLKDEDGRVLIDGFYDRVRDPDPAERRQWAALPFDEERFRASTGSPRVHGEAGFSTLERRWARPTCDVNGLFGGYQGEGAKTVLPARAGAKVSFRLVPDQDADEISKLFRRHIEAAAPPTVRVTVNDLHTGNPVVVPTDNAAMAAARRAMARGFGQEPVMIREGGSIPIVGTFQKALDVPVLLLGFGRNDDNAHSPNEKFNLDDYHHGIRTVACLFEEMAAV